MKKFLKKRFLGIPLFAILSVVLVGTVALAVVTISNLWTSPDITVTKEPIPPPDNELLVISSPDFTEARSIYKDSHTYISVQTVNPSPSGAPGYSDVLFEFAIYNAGIAEGDVILEYREVVGGDWLPLALTQGESKLVGTFGPAGGFPVGYGYDVTTEFRAKFTKTGIYYAQVQAVGTSN